MEELLVYHLPLIGSSLILPEDVKESKIKEVKIQKDYHCNRDEMIHFAYFDPQKDSATLKKVYIDDEISEPCYCVNENRMHIFPEAQERSVVQIIYTQ